MAVNISERLKTLIQQGANIPPAASGTAPEGGPSLALPLDPSIAAGIAERVKAETPSAQFAAQQGAPAMPTSGVDTILNPFVQPEGVPMGAPTDLSSLFGMGAAGLGPVSPNPMSSPALGAGLPSYDAGMAPTMAPSVSPFAQPQVPPELAMGQAQGQAITGATTLADLVSRGLGGQMPQAPQIPQLAAQPFAQAMPQAMPQAPVAAPQMAPQAAFPQAPGIAQPAAPSGMASLFAPPPAPPQVQSPQQPYGQFAPIQPPVQAAGQPQVPAAPAPSPFQAFAPAPAAPAPVAPAPVQQAAPAPAPVAQAPAAPAPAPAPARQQPARRGAPLQTDPYAVNPAEDFPEALAARRANQRADGNDPGRPYQPAPYERPDEPAPIEQPEEQPAEAPVEPELEPAMAGSPLQNAQPNAPALVNGELMISGGNRRFARGGPVGDDAGGKGVSPNLLQRVGLTRAILSQFVDRSIVGTMMVPDRPMDNADDVAALAYEYLRKQPQENFMAVILDGQGRPIQILRHTLGAISATNFIPHVIAGVAASTRGARTVYMVHNHPSTTTRFSNADVMAAQSLSKTIEAIGMRFGGSLVVTDGDAAEGNMTPKYIFHPGGELVEHTPAATSTRGADEASRAVHPVVVFDDRPGSETTAEILVVERTFEVRKEALFPRITSPQEAVLQIPPLLRNQSGVALIDNAGRLVGVIPMSIGEMRNVSSSGSMIYPSQGQDRDYISSEEDRAPGEVDKRPYKRTQFSKDTQPGAWNNPLAMLMAALERSNAERVIISIGADEIGTSGRDIRSEAIKNLQKALLRTAGKKVEIDDVINNKRNFPDLVLRDTFYNGSYSTSPDEKGGRLSTGRRLGFNEEGAAYGDQGKEGDQAPIEQAPQSLGDVVSQGMEGENVAETNPDDPNAQADFDRQEREAGARVNPPGITTPSGLDNAKPAEPVIKKPRKPRAKKAAGVNVSGFPKLDATPGAFGRLSGEQMKQFGLSDAMLDQFIEHSTYGQVMSGVQSVKTDDDAAHIVAAMRKRPQEQIVLLITDKNGKPLQIAVHSLGGPASAGFNPGILIGAAASTPGAAKVWFIHNHPSGKSSLSPADMTAGNSVENLCKAANLRYMATMAVAGSKYAVMNNSGAIMSALQIPPHPRKFSIPLTERIFSYRVSQDTPAFADPAVAGPAMKRIFGESQPGIILADNSNRPVAAIPLDGDVMQAMRAILPGENPSKQTGFAKYAAGVERSGGVNMFIYTADLPMELAIKVIENMSKVANATKVTALDAMNSNEVALTSHIRSYGTDFNEPGSSYNAGQDAQEGEADAPQSIEDVVNQGLSEPQKKKTKR